MPSYLAGYVDRMLAVSERLAKVSLECLPAEQIISRYGGHSSTLLYVDPPYPASVRNSRNYQYEMPDEERHRQLADSLRSCSATVVLSGYPGRLYDDVLYADWHRYEIAASTSQSGKGQVRIEVLWSNRALL